MILVTSEGVEPGSGEEVEALRGPHGWLNWQAEKRGQPRREAAHPDNVVIHPIWQEFALYTDAQLGGGWLTTGPYEFIHIDHIEVASIGTARKLVVLRAWDHFVDEPPKGPWEVKTDVQDYFGGDIGDEMTALLALALSCRFRSGGQVRQGLPIDSMPLGLPDEKQHQAPALQPPHRRPMIDTLAGAKSLQEAKGLLESYPMLDGPDAVALVRSARQYADGLWLADADPRIAWIKFVGALEAAANQWDGAMSDTPVERLKRHRRAIYDALDGCPEGTLAAVADDLAHTLKTVSKFRNFVLEFDPGPPPSRPEGTGWHFDWSELGDALTVIYDHRSRDLHDGIAFPWPLCEPPHITEEGLPAERFPASGVGGQGGRWTAEQLPMYLHVFEHVVGGALRNWWLSLKS